ncbi:MAG: hypothetical protein WED11_07285, partial [Natronospirillum sp.]
MHSSANKIASTGILTRRLVLPSLVVTTTLASHLVMAQVNDESVDVETLLVIGQRGQARSALDSPVP